LALGAIPGLGGVIGLTILIPFVYDLGPVPAMAMLIGMAAVTTTSDSIPAILFGIPGTVAAQATILDGYPMTQKGEAARALGASFSASAIGGVLGAIVLFASIPVLRPLVLQFRSPEFLMLALLGISMVAVLSRGALAKGLGAAGFGLMLTTVGQDPLTGTFRYVYDTDYLWEGLPLIAIALGIFAIPEIIDMVLAGGNLARDVPKTAAIDGRQKWRGIRDTMADWSGVMRSSTLGVFIGIIPGLGGTVVDWFAYGMAKQLARNTETFGTGDVRGVIAVDAASNAKEGGALVTTIAFGVPGSVTMALLLSAFQIQGLIPGPLMLTKQIDVTLTLVWGLVLANVIGAIICFMFVSQIARISMINVHRIFPVLITVIYLGAFQGRQVMGDLVALLLLGLLGWAMKRGGWPRPPLILGFILGAKIEDSLWLTTERYGWEWLTEPLPAFIGLLCLASIGVGIFYQPGQGRRARAVWRARVQWSLRPLLTAVFGITCVFFIVESRDWVYEALLFPVAIAVPTLALVTYQLVHDLFATTGPGPTVQFSDIKPVEVEDGKSLHRAASEAFGWLAGLLLVIWIAGFPVAMILFTLLYLRFRSREKWWVAITTTTVMIGLLFLVFDGLLNVIWPEGLIAGG
ncbi:MAG: tripartite tricarboxylate transporter permease, partial [Alphaproteobacteria bacterium]